MAYPNYYSPFYQPSYSPQQVAQNAPMPNVTNGTQNSGITWVQGEASAKSYPVLAGQSILLMDSEDSVFYIKSTDQSGMPLPLRIFDYQERKQEHTEAPTVTQPKVDYVSRSEFENFKEEIKSEIKQANNRPAPVRKNTKED